VSTRPTPKTSTDAAAAAVMCGEAVSIPELWGRRIWQRGTEPLILVTSGKRGKRRTETTETKDGAASTP
jgi:hypothetical protein